MMHKRDKEWERCLPLKDLYMKAFGLIIFKKEKEE